MELESHWPLLGGSDVRDELLTAYASPDRGYHDVRHLTEVLTRLDELAEQAAFERTEVLLAAWFHDSVYDGEPAAEERSAVWAEAVLPPIGVPEATVAEVGRLVRLTQSHRPGRDDPNGAALTDADLAILAATPERYAEYVADVRREYAHVPEPLFSQGRAAILSDLLAKPTLFHTVHAVSAWEARARSNVQAELIALERAVSGAK